jgi:hypothetical protein
MTDLRMKLGWQYTAKLNKVANKVLRHSCLQGIGSTDAHLADKLIFDGLPVRARMRGMSALQGSLSSS